VTQKTEDHGPGKKREKTRIPQENLVGGVKRGLKKAPERGGNLGLSGEGGKKN